MPMFLQTLAFLWLLLFTAVNTFYSQLPAKTVQWNVLASDPLNGPWNKYSVQMWMQILIQQVAREPLWEVGEKQSIIYQWRRNGSKRILIPTNEYINPAGALLEIKETH